MKRIDPYWFGWEVQFTKMKDFFKNNIFLNKLTNLDLFNKLNKQFILLNAREQKNETKRTNLTDSISFLLKFCFSKEGNRIDQNS